MEGASLNYGQFPTIKGEEAEHADINTAKWIDMRVGVYRSFILNYSLGGSGFL